MSKSFFPFEEGTGAVVNQEQWRAIATLWRTTGVIYEDNNSLLAYADSSGMQVKVKAGTAYIEGFYFNSTAEETLAISAADADDPRYDRIIIRCDWINHDIDFAVLEGTPAGSPTVPALTQDASTYEISLATVFVDEDVVTIASDDVVTDRIWSTDPGGGADVLTVQVFS